MRFSDVCVMLSFLVVIAVIARMLKAIRLLDGRVTLLQEQISQSRAVMKKGAAANPRTPAPVVAQTAYQARNSVPAQSPGEVTTYEIEETDVETLLASMTAEQERMKKAMGRDFQVRPGKRSAAAIRGKRVG
ncbi:MAG: hypothetical protein ABSF35_00895 [Polyangia bacterium]